MRVAVKAWILGTVLASACPVSAQPRAETAEARDGIADGALGDPIIPEVLRASERGNWAESAVLLHRAASAPATSVRQRAELRYRLGIALYEAGLYCASRAVFERIAGDPRHPAFRRALPWIARLAEHLPEPAGLARTLRAYTDADAAGLRDPRHFALFWTQAYLRGTDAAVRGRHNEAVRLFGLVDPESAHFVDASLGSAQSQLALRQPIGALWTLAALLHARSAWQSKTFAPERVEDLAHLTMARILYSKAVRRLRDGTIAVEDSAKLAAALQHYGAVSERDPLGTAARQATLESAWVRFLLGDRRGAARGIQRLAWDWLSAGDAVSEQALLFELRLRREQGEPGSARLANALREQAAARRDGIQRLLDAYGGRGSEAELVTRALEVVEGVSRLDAGLRRSLEARVLVPRVLRAMNYVRVVEYEITRVDRMPESFRASPLGAEIEDALSRTWQDAVAVAARRTQAGLRRAAAELDDVAVRAHDAGSARAL